MWHLALHAASAGTYHHAAAASVERRLTLLLRGRFVHITPGGARGLLLLRVRVMRRAAHDGRLNR
jgi:hypothetical protein